MQYDSNTNKLFNLKSSIPSYALICKVNHSVLVFKELLMKMRRLLFCSQLYKQTVLINGNLGNGCGCGHLLMYTFIPNLLERQHYLGSAHLLCSELKARFQENGVM